MSCSPQNTALHRHPYKKPLAPLPVPSKTIAILVRLEDMIKLKTRICISSIGFNLFQIIDCCTQRVTSTGEVLYLTGACPFVLGKGPGVDMDLSDMLVAADEVGCAQLPSALFINTPLDPGPAHCHHAGQERRRKRVSTSIDAS